MKRSKWEDWGLSQQLLDEGKWPQLSTSTSSHASFSASGRRMSRAKAERKTACHMWVLAGKCPLVGHVLRRASPFLGSKPK